MKKLENGRILKSPSIFLASSCVILVEQFSPVEHLEERQWSGRKLKMHENLYTKQHRKSRKKLSQVNQF